APLTQKAVFWRSFWQRLLVWPFVRTFARIRVRGYENVKDLQGPVMFCPNHISPIDGTIILKALPSRFQARTAIASASDVVYENPAVKSHVKKLEILFNVYPFSRETQVKSSLEYTGRLLDRGFSIMLFPEGHMARQGKLQPVKLGAGLIAIQMGVPIVPVGVTGVDKMVPPDAEGLMMPHKAVSDVVFGKPLVFPVGTPVHDAARQIHDALAQILPPEMLDTTGAVGD
ncbi:MAG: lysophospholipid acyltransferase family protein, partial [Armatimonadota bacterium]